MTNPFDDDEGQFLVLINVEEQYSIWPDYIDVPEGWSKVGPHGNRKECMDWIDAIWTDMRPANLRRQMEEDAKSSN